MDKIQKSEEEQKNLCINDTQDANRATTNNPDRFSSTALSKQIQNEGEEPSQTQKFEYSSPDNNQIGDVQSSPDQQTQGSNSAWIYYAFATALFFTACNTTISSITQKVGPLCLLYFSFGSMLAGFFYNTYHAIINVRKPQGKFWVNQNLIVGGQIKIKNVVGYLVFCLVYFLIQNMAFLTMWFADLAQVNVGVITVIWCVHPLFIAIADYLVFGTKLKYFHIVGMSLIVAGTILITLQKFIIPTENIDSLQKVNQDVANQATGSSKRMIPILIPVIFGLLTPVFFTINGLVIHKMTGPSFGMCFNGSDLSMSCYFFVNVLILIFAIFFWQKHTFDMHLFILGTVGSILNTIGISLNTTAYSKGPLGPVSAITATSSVMLVIEEAIRNLKAPTWVEILVVCLGFVGALELVYPEGFEKLFRKLGCCKKNQSSDQIDQQQLVE